MDPALGVTPEPVVPSADDPIDLLVERYRAYLLGERRLAAGKVRYYERVARLFLAGSRRRVASWIGGD